MRGPTALLWAAGFVQLLIAAANIFIPKKLHYSDNLGRLSPIVRQVFVVHSIYIVGIVLLFAVVSFGFAAELTSGHGLGQFLAAAIAVFWLFRVPVQLFYYDSDLRRVNRAGDLAFTIAAFFLASAYATATFWGRL